MQKISIFPALLLSLLLTAGASLLQPAMAGAQALPPAPQAPALPAIPNPLQPAPPAPPDPTAQTPAAPTSQTPAQPTAQTPGTPASPAATGTPDPTAQSDPSAATPVASPDPCSGVSASGTVGGVAQALTPGDDDDDYPDPTPTGPTPANPTAVKSCENGAIQMQVLSPREYGYRIGDVIPVRILIVADKKVTIDFSSLKQGVLGFDGADFQLATDNAVVINTKTKGDLVAYIIDLNVQTFVPKPAIVFNLDLRYATGLAPNSKTPDWKVLTTPDFVVSTSTTTDTGQALKEGPTDSSQSPFPWLMWPGLIVGFVLVFLWPGLKLVSWLNRVRPGRKVPANEVAWKTLTKVFDSAKEYGFTEKHYKQIASVVRRYFATTLNRNFGDFETLTRAEVKERFAIHPQIATIDSVLAKCDKALYAKAALSDAENALLIAQIETLVPRPRH